jgi:GxxExxY protein
MKELNQITGEIIGKAIEVHYAQILTYMKLGGFKAGLLINFNVISLRKGGIKRFIL